MDAPASSSRPRVSSLSPDADSDLHRRPTMARQMVEGTKLHDQEDGRASPSSSRFPLLDGCSSPSVTNSSRYSTIGDLEMDSFILPSPMPRWVAWIFPLGCLWFCSYLQTAALYFSTWTYVDCMDKVLKKRARFGTVDSAGLPIEPSTSIGIVALIWILETSSLLLPFLWLSLTLRKRNLRCWSRTLFAGAALLSLEAVVLWCTVLSPVGGFTACEQRLGPTGITYYRTRPSTSLNSWLDIGLLQAVHFLKLCSSRDTNFCVGSILSGPTALRALFCRSLLEVLGCPMLEAPGDQHACRKRLVAVLIELVTTINFLLPVLEESETTCASLLGIVVGPLLYTNPAVCIAAERWVRLSGASEGHRIGSGDSGWLFLPFWLKEAAFFLREELHVHDLAEAEMDRQEMLIQQHVFLTRAQESLRFTLQQQESKLCQIYSDGRAAVARLSEQFEEELGEVLAREDRKELLHDHKMLAQANQHLQAERRKRLELQQRAEVLARQVEALEGAGGT